MVSSVWQLPCSPGDESAEPVGHHINGVTCGAFTYPGSDYLEGQGPDRETCQYLDDMWRNRSRSVSERRNCRKKQRQKTGNEKHVVEVASEERCIKAEKPGGGEVADIDRCCKGEDTVFQ